MSDSSNYPENFIRTQFVLNVVGLVLGYLYKGGKVFGVENILDSYFLTKVLIVDDDLNSTIPIAHVLMSEGCSVDVVDSGYQGAKNLLIEKYDLIIIDWSMPHFNGGKTIELMDKLVNNKRLPYVLYTGVNPQSISLPNSSNLQLIDFWQKAKFTKGGASRAKSVVQRIKKGKA